MSRKAAKAAKKLRLSYQPPARKPAPKEIALSELEGDFGLASQLLRLQFAQEWTLERQDPLVSRKLAKGLFAVLTYRFPKHELAFRHRTAAVPPDHLRAWNQPKDDLFRLALANVRNDGLLEHRKIPYPEGFVLEYVLEKFNDFAASHVLFLEEYLDPAPPGGAIVALPTQSEVMLCRMDGSAVKAGLQYIVNITPEVCMESSSGVSPHVYWWRDGTLSHLTTRGAHWPYLKDNFTLPPDFLEVYRDLIGR